MKNSSDIINKMDLLEQVSKAREAGKTARVNVHSGRAAGLAVGLVLFLGRLLLFDALGSVLVKFLQHCLKETSKVSIDSLFPNPDTICGMLKLTSVRH